MSTRRTRAGSTPTAANRRAPSHRVSPTPTVAKLLRQSGTAVRDDDDALPPIQNNNSKAYGASGNIAGPTQMDVNQAFRRPEQALSTAVAQSSARVSDMLPVIAESAADSVQDRVDQQIQNELHVAVDDSGESSNETTAFLNFTTWAPHGRGVASIPTSRLATMLNSFFPMIYRNFVAPLRRLSSFTWLVLFIALVSSLNLAVTSYNSLFKEEVSVTAANLHALAKVNAETKQEIADVQRQVDLLAASINTETRLQVNWFDIGQGAVIHPHLSSPSFSAEEPRSWVSYYTSFFKDEPFGQDTSLINHPSQALMPWSEGGIERWCAPRGRGKLQLTVMTARPLAPKELIVEHIAKAATWKIGTAPREIELWADIDDPAVHFEVHGAILKTNPALLDISSPQKETELSHTQALPAQFLPIGRWYYDIHANKAVQNFNVPLDLARLGVKSSRFAFRVNSNWGSYDVTCINRVRLHGDDMSREAEGLEPPL